MPIITSTLLCLSLAVYFEARGEPILGQQAVIQVVLNRAERNKTTPCIEVFKPKQFSWTSTHWKIPKATNKEWQHSLQVVKQTLAKRQTIKLNAIYFKHIYVKRKIANHINYETTIGNHVFFSQK